MSLAAAVPSAPLRSRYQPGREIALGAVLGPLALGGSGDPTIQRDGAAWWLALATPAGEATLHLRPRDGGVDVIAWGPGAERAVDDVPTLLGADDDDSGFDPRAHPVVAQLHHRSPGLRLPRARRVLPYLIPTIMAQKVTGIEAKHAWRVLVRRHGTRAPGPAPEGMRVAPAAAAWRRIPSWEWHRAGVGPQRSDTIMRVVAAAVGDAIERTSGLDGAEAVRRMRTIAGIGVWTAHETVQRSHGDPDSVSIGDLHLCKLVGTALVGHRVDDDAMMELLEPFRGHRHRVVRLIELSGIRFERFGPRATIPEHRTR
ncbi:MAG TPA: DNA-3-methyladenine glycosylase 2 family protein [Pseudolysinimonas sp.]|nr:DNA-3-methyladenine glycosylase 2 family protein [Pseudolysinimonas sp.]